MIASAENKQKAKEWLRPFNMKGVYGLASGNLRASAIGLPAIGGTTRLDLALTGAFELGADTILIISDGLPEVRKPLSDEHRREMEARTAQWEKENARARSQMARLHEKSVHGGKGKEVKVWVPGTPRAEGRPATEGRWEVQYDYGYHDRVKLTPRPDVPREWEWWSLSDFVVHFNALNAQLYEKKGRSSPVVHCIGYCIDDAGSSFLQSFSKNFKGRYKRVGGKIGSENSRGAGYPVSKPRSAQ